MRKLENITPIEEDFGRWFEDVVTQGNLMEYGPVKGTMIYKPISYGIWENVQKEINIILKKEGVENVYLPLLIPESYISKEKEHVKGFAPELATVTRVGKKNLAESVVIRPTSEMLFGDLFQKEVNSYNDLPIKYNQWANVVRWEKTTNPFLRNSEFLWQEGHTCHANSIEARKMTKIMIKIYAKFFKKYLAIPVVIGRKTSNEKFAGAVSTYTIEAMMKDGKALQSGTSHYLGQNFAKALNIKFQTKENKQEYVYQTSWGISTRLIGAIIMTHGDDRGAIMPPMIASTQIDILEIFGNKNKNVKVQSAKLYKQLSKKYKVRLDSSSKGPGFKSAKSEIEGTPLRIEVGPRDLENDLVTLVRRDTLEKVQVKLQDVKITVAKILKDIQSNLLKVATERLENNIIKLESYEAMKKALEQKKFVLVPFAGGSKEEKIIKKETFATTRCIPFNWKLKEEKKCIITGVKTKRLVMFAKAY